MDEVIGGISNRIVKRRLRYAEINNVPDLRRQAVRLVAAERQCYAEGTSESTSMDGLTATSHIKNEQYGDDDMDVDDDRVRAIRHPPAGKAENPKVNEVIRENVIPAKEQDT